MKLEMNSAWGTSGPPKESSCSKGDARRAKRHSDGEVWWPGWDMEGESQGQSDQGASNDAPREMVDQFHRERFLPDSIKGKMHMDIALC